MVATGEAQDTTSTLDVRLLGRFDVRVNGTPIPALRSRSVQWMLALLILRHDREVDRSWLAGTLWPESTSTQALYNLRQSLTNLRHVLGTAADRLHSPTSRTLTLDLTHATVDLLDFDRAVSATDEVCLERAITLYGGPLLEGCLEEWVLAERQARERAYLIALERVAGLALDRADTQQAIGYLYSVIAVDPLRESAVRTLMHSLAQQGDHAAMTQVYRDFRLRLHDELNAQPDTDTVSLYRLLRAEAKEKAQPIPRSLVPSAASLRHMPASPTSFIGRATETATVIDLLGRTRMLTLTGTGGVGKTRLALTVAEEIAEEYQDGVCFVDLASLQEPALVAKAVASAMEVREQPSRTLIETLLDALQERSLLLILDNCEHLLDGCSSVAEALLGRCPYLRLLATSRQPLGLAGERTWRVPSLTLPEGSEEEWDKEKGAQTLLMGSEAVRLFVERAGSASAAFRLTRENLVSIAQLCRLLDGIPLALELAAAWVRMMPVAQVVSRLGDRLDLLQSRHPGRLGRHQTLRATLDWSYDLLEEREQRLMRRLSVFASGWTLDAAETVGCADEGDEVLFSLAGLVDKSLVIYEEREGEARYRFLETTRQYAREKLRESGEESTLRLSHRDFCLGLAEEATPHLNSGAQAQWLRRLDAEHDNLRTALDCCLRDADGVQIGLRLVHILSSFWAVRGHTREGRERVAAFLARSDAAPPTKVRADALNSAGSLAINQGDYDAARSLVQESLVAQRVLGDQLGIGICLNNLAITRSGQCDYAAARPLYEECLAIMRALGEARRTAMCLENLGQVAERQGEYAAAFDLISQALALFRQLDDSHRIAACLNLLGIVAKDRGEYNSARALFTECLAVRHELGDKRGMAFVRGNLGIVVMAQGEHEAARILVQETVALCRELGDKYGIAVNLGNLGGIAVEQGDYAAAQTYLTESLALGREIGYKHGIAVVLDALAGLAVQQGDYLTARLLYEEALALNREIGSRSNEAITLAALAVAVQQQGDPESAATYLLESLVMLQQLGDNGHIVVCIETLSTLDTVRSTAERRVCLAGAAAALREARRTPLSPVSQKDMDDNLTQLRMALSDEAFAVAWAEGQAMTLEQAVEYALREQSDP